MSQIVVWAVVALAATGVVRVGSGLLERASEPLSARYRLPEIVRGAIVVTIGSSFSELSTTVISASLHGAFDLGVAAIVGWALFNILAIPALRGLPSRAPMETNRDVVFKEAQFYMIAVAVLTLAFAFAVTYRPVEGGALAGEMTRPMGRSSRSGSTLSPSSSSIRRASTSPSRSAPRRSAPAGSGYASPPPSRSR